MRLKFWSLPHCCLTPPLQETTANIRTNLILPESRVVGLHLRRWLCAVCLHSSFRGRLRKTHVFCNTVRNGPSRSSKVVDFGINRKRVFDFLLVINSNLGPILPRFRDTAGFLRRATPPLFHPNFRGVPLWLYCCVVAPRSEGPKLIIRVINFGLVQPICSRTYVNVTDGQTWRTTYDSNTALCTTCIAR